MGLGQVPWRLAMCLTFLILLTIFLVVKQAPEIWRSNSELAEPVVGGRTKGLTLDELDADLLNTNQQRTVADPSTRGERQAFGGGDPPAQQTAGGETPPPVSTIRGEARHQVTVQGETDPATTGSSLQGGPATAGSNLQGGLGGADDAFPPSNDLARRLENLNANGRILNSELFPAEVDGRIPIVLYVHKRPEYLKVVLDGLAHVDGINETLLIVSHDGYVEEVVDLVRSVRFCRVKQIFAPFSPHNFPDTYPGAAPYECIPKAPPLGTPRGRCKGDPSHPVRYREPHIVSLKLHWWWLMNHVWDKMEELTGHNGHILFMEEDHYMAPHAYRALQVLARVQAHCSVCVGVSLGLPDHNMGNRAAKQYGAAKMPNLAYAFDRATWRKVKNDARPFCTYNDYNWDETIKWAVLAHWPAARLFLHPPVPAVTHVGQCGLHVKENSCELQNISVASFLRAASYGWPLDHRWPIEQHGDGRESIDFIGFGGWADKRDHRLCLHFAGQTLEEGGAQTLVVDGAQALEEGGTQTLEEGEKNGTANSNSGIGRSGSNGGDGGGGSDSGGGGGGSNLAGTGESGGSNLNVVGSVTSGNPGGSTSAGQTNGAGHNR